MIFLRQYSFLFGCLFFALPPLLGQDTAVSFAYEDYIKIVKEHHPIAFQASLKEAQGEAYLQKGKGGFDPKLYGDMDQKYFDGKNYYSHFNSGLKIPTWFGISLDGGYENNSGERLNPELFTPANAGLFYAGVSMSLGKGLFIDQRRAELQQARIMQDLSEVEQRLIMNQLVYDASLAYWDWFKAFHKVIIYEDATANANFRLQGIRASFQMGDLPAYDTLKALILVQDYNLKLEQSRLDLLNKKSQLEVFLWQDGFVPLELGVTMIPTSYKNIIASFPQLDILGGIDTLITRHPEMQEIQYGIQLSEIDYRMKKEALKPSLDLKYNALGTTAEGALIETYSINNYKWGASLSYPVFTRKERAEVKLTALKIQEQEAKMYDKAAQLGYKIKATHNTWASSAVQIEIYRETVNNYGLLFDAELTLFTIGESSLFLVNARDQSRIEAQLKLIDLIVQNYVTNASFNYQIIRF